MRDTLRLYLRYLGLSVRSQLQYRASLLLQTVAQFAITAGEFGMVYALFARFGQLQGWTLPEMALLYGLANSSFALAEMVGRGFDLFPQRIVRGEFDRLLVRPRGLAFQVAAEAIHLRCGRLAQALVILAWGAQAAEVAWSGPQVALLIGAVAGGACLFVGLFIGQATLAFWTIEGLEIVNTVTYGGVEASQYPISIYRPGFRRFFTWVVPLATVTYLPTLALLARPDPLGSAPAWQAAAPLTGLVFLLLMLRFWEFGVRHYRSTGS